jgi:hypothetical protein
MQRQLEQNRWTADAGAAVRKLVGVHDQRSGARVLAVRVLVAFQPFNTPPQALDLFLQLGQYPLDHLERSLDPSELVFSVPTIHGLDRGDGDPA